MGGATSRFSETDWEVSDGGLTEACQTIDGREPTSSHAILTLKKTTLVNQREFEIRDDDDELLYTSRAVEGTTKWFDFFQADGKKIFCVQTDAARIEWNIYSLCPNWEGQESREAISEPQPSEPLFEAAQAGAGVKEEFNQPIQPQANQPTSQRSCGCPSLPL